MKQLDIKSMTQNLQSEKDTQTKQKNLDFNKCLVIIGGIILVLLIITAVILCCYQIPVGDLVTIICAYIVGYTTICTGYEFKTKYLNKYKYAQLFIKDIANTHGIEYAVQFTDIVTKD